MKKLLILLPLLASNAYAQVRMPDDGGIPKVSKITNFVKPLTDTQPFWAIEDFIKAIKRQPIKQGHGKVSIDTARKIQLECNNKRFSVMDYFPTAEEFAKSSSGDCKGFAMCKYYKLREAGFTDDQINIWSGKYKGQPHMILTVETDGKEIVMDIMEPDMPEAKKYFYRNFKPEYRFNEHGWDVN